MAIGTRADIKVYDEQFHAGFTEVVAQNVDGFNAVSNNALRLVTNDAMGDYRKDAFFAEVSGLVSYRDPTSTAAQTPKKLEEKESVAVRIPRKQDEVQNTLESFRRAGFTMEEFNFRLGEQVAKAMIKDMINTSILSLDAALDGQTTQEFDATDGTLEIEDLIRGENKMGDAMGKIRAWVMHSKVVNDLRIDHVQAGITNIADAVILGATPASLGKPIIMIDAPALFRDLTTDNYVTLGLVENAAVVEQAGEPDVLIEQVGGGENITMRRQAEWSFFLGLQGFAYDTTNGQEDPTDATLSTSTNWDKVATDAKNLAGVHIVSQ